MNKNTRKCSFAFALVLASNATHAQVGPCPPGMSQYPSPSGVPSCGPRRLGQATGHWQTQWGAIAGGNDGTSGWASNQSDEDSAKRIAIENCVSRGGSQCEVELTYRNGCIAVVNGSGVHNAASDATAKRAVHTALDQCNKDGGKDCHVFRVECSPAKWVSN